MGKGSEESGQKSPVKITFDGGEKNECHEITSEHVIVCGSSGSHDHGSSKVKLKNIVDYKWEVKNYPGHLIAAHIDGKCMAYVIKVNNKLSGTEGMVRVINDDKRVLIKGMSEVLDVQFAHIEKQYILACIELQMLHVYKIDTIADSLVCNVLLQINDPIANYTPKFDKVAWCPFVPDETIASDDDIPQLLVWSRGNCVQCFDVREIGSSYGAGKHAADGITDGQLKLIDAAVIATWVALSPDGTTLSVGSDDGYIRFYQVYFHEKEPRCLHQWYPHDGKPISSFFFLDNLIKSPSDIYWKDAITGADRNTEFKIWDCGTWTCLQTLSLNTANIENMSFTADIDRTASYLIISSIQNRVLYVVQLINNLVNTAKSIENGEKKDEENSPETDENANKTLAFMKSISEFPLSSPILSFSIVDATIRKYKCQDNENFLEEFDDFDEENSAACCVVVRLFVVQPKSVQECHIIYQPTVPETVDVRSTLSSDSLGNYNDSILEPTMLWNPSKENSPEQVKTNLPIAPVEQPSSGATKNPYKGSSQLNLMTPDSFNRKIEKNASDVVNSDVLSTLLMLASVTSSNSSSAKNAENINLLNLVNNKMIEDREQQKYAQSTNQQPNFRGPDVTCINSEAIASGGSSPSREVQQILGENGYSKTDSIFVEKSKSDNDLMQHVDNDSSQNLLDSGGGAKARKPVNWPKVPNITEKPIDIKAAGDDVGKNDLVDSKINELLAIVKSQSAHIMDLKKDIEMLKNQRQELPKSNKDIENRTEINKLLEDHFVRCDRQQERCFKSFLTASSTQNRELRDSIIQPLNQFLYSQFTEELSRLASGIKQDTITVLTQKLDALKQQLQTEISQKLAITEKVFKENIAQMCKSKNLVEAFGNSVVLGIQSGLQNVYVQSMSDTLIPAYERSSQEMFKQLHQAFSMGIKDIIDQFENYLGLMQPIQDGTKDILVKIGDLQKHVDAVFLKQKSSVTESALETKKELKSIETIMIRNLTDVIQKEIRKNFETQAASLEDSVILAMRSQTQTPGPSIYEVQDQVKSLLSQGHINKAFHQALIANDLALVEYTLERADYKRVFNPCTLEQTVLLSLIQQISADMDNHNEIKQKYLADGLLNLNHTDPITKEHAPRVLRELYKNCENFITTNPKSSLCSNVRMIMMAVQGLGYKVLQ